MKYIIILIVLTFSVYPLSYAKYNWNENNKFGAIGSIFVAIASVVLPSVLILLR